MRTLLFFGLLYLNCVLLSCEQSQKEQTELILMRVINNTSQSYRLSVINCILPCEQKDGLYCMLHQKIKPVALIMAFSQKLFESPIELDYRIKTSKEAWHKGKLLLENLMKPEEYIVISMEQWCRYQTKAFRFKTATYKPNKTMVSSYEEPGSLSHNCNFNVSFDVTINSLILASVELSFMCQNV
jgi:hypothetical protein